MQLPSQMWLARLAQPRDVKPGAKEVLQAVLKEGLESLENTAISTMDSNF